MDGPTLIGEMIALRRDGRSGVLEVATEEAPTLIYYVGGKMVFAEQGRIADSFGRVLVESGWITAEQFERAVSRMAGRPFQSEQWCFSEVVVELGLLTVEQVTDALALHVQERIVDCLTLENAAFAFKERPDPVDRAARFSMKLEPLVLAATARLEADRLDVILGPPGRYAPTLLESPEAIAARFELTGADQWTLGRVDGKRSTAELVSFDPSAAALIAALVRVACVEQAEAKPSVPVAPRSDAPRDKDDAGSGRPPTPSGPSEISLADAAFRSGKRHLLDGDARAALPYLRRAVKLGRPSLEVGLCLRWAESRAGAEGQAAPQHVVAKLFELAAKAVKEEPKMAFGYYVLGHFAKDRGDNKRAVAMFRRAVELEASFIDAARQLRLLSSD